MTTNKKWDDASQKDLLCAMLMSTGDGNIKADWKEVEKIMTSWGYTFTIGAMSQHWSKTIQKAFKERHPDNSKEGGNTEPATPQTPKTPAHNKGKGKGKPRKRLSSDEDTPSAKKMKLSQQTDVDDEEHVVVEGETETEEDHNHSA